MALPDFLYGSIKTCAHAPRPRCFSSVVYACFCVCVSCFDMWEATEYPSSERVIVWYLILEQNQSTTMNSSNPSRQTVPAIMMSGIIWCEQEDAFVCLSRKG